MKDTPPISLRQSGFKGSSCPITHTMSPNLTKSFSNFHISFNADEPHYGGPTTAIVLDQRVFFILNGNHGALLSECVEMDGLQGAIDYFIDHLHQASKFSEHLMATLLSEDVFSLHQTAIEVIGKDNIQRVREGALFARSQVQ